MNNKEAIERLKRGAPFDEIYDETYEEAIGLAIKALEAIERLKDYCGADMRGDV
jgi:hypothetical protein